MTRTAIALPQEQQKCKTDPSVSCKEQLCADTQKHFKSAGTAAIRRTPKPHNTNTQQHTHLTLLSHSCLTIAKQSRSLCFPTFWLDTMAPAALGLGWGSWSRPALMS